MITGDKSEFQKWYDNFYSINKGLRIYDSWFNQVEENHHDLRKFLGGINVSRKVEIDRDDDSIEYRYIKDLVENLIFAIPEYFYENPINPTAFRSPMTMIGSRKMRWTTVISFWIDKKIKLGASLDKKAVDKILSKMGEVWAANRLKKEEIYVNIGTAAEDFVLIGHYGPDNKSCFKQGGQHQIDKYILGAAPNTFVLLLSHEPTRSIGKIEGRLWGIANPSLNVFNVCNSYLNENINEGTAQKAVDAFFNGLLGSDIICNEGHFGINPVYLNNKGINRTYRKPIKADEHQSYSINILPPMSDVKVCRACSIGELGFKVYTLEGSNFCDRCYNNLPLCQWSNERVLEGRLIRAFNREGQEISISLAFYHDGTFKRCGISGIYTHKDDIVQSRAYKEIAKFIAKQNGFEECPKCKHWEQLNPSKKDKNVKICSTCELKNTIHDLTPKNKKEVITLNDNTYSTAYTYWTPPTNTQRRTVRRNYIEPQ